MNQNAASQDVREHVSTQCKQPSDRMDIRTYRQWCDRRREASRTRTGQPRLDGEAYEIVRFARRWATFGGAPADEIFIHFGLSPAQYAERLRSALRVTGER